MKKIVGLGLVLICGVVLVGCNNKENTVSKDKDNQTTVSSKKENTLNISEFNIPEEVSRVASDFPEDFISSDKLSVEVGTYFEDGERCRETFS